MALDNNEFSDQLLVVSDNIKVPSVDGNTSGFILCLGLLEYIRGRLNKSDVGLSNVPNYDFTDRVSAMEGKIPSQASSSNQLADKAFVNSSISTSTAEFKGTFATLEALKAVQGADINDYAFWAHKDSDGNTLYDRYKYTLGSDPWKFEYRLNNSSFTSAQWDALNSGITAVLCQIYDSHLTSKSNPHEVTKAQVGLDNVDNTSDVDKPISTLMQQALDAEATARQNADTLMQQALEAEMDSLLTGYLKMPIQDNAGFHNSLYRGKNITSYWTDGSLWDRIQGTNGKKLFEDLYVGDWFSTGTHSINGTSADQCFMIGGFDLRLGVGSNNVTKHHIVPVPCNSTGTDTRGLFNSQMYAEVPFTGAYQGSIVHPLFLPDGAASTDLKAIFGSHLLQSSELISTANNSNGYGRYGSASGVSTSWAWVDVCGILMSEVEVYGSVVWSSSGYDGGMSSRGQLPMFRLRPDLISSRSWDFWLRDATSARGFARVDSRGNAGSDAATSSFGVRPRFLIG